MTLTVAEAAKLSQIRKLFPFVSPSAARRRDAYQKEKDHALEF